MAAERRVWAYPLAVLGAIGLASSLWLPWYSFRIPAPTISGVERLSGQAGALGPVLRQAAESLSKLGPQHLTAWQILNQIPVVLVLAAAAGGALGLLALAGRARGVGRVIAGTGALGLAVAGFRALFPPHDVLHTAWGAWLAVGSSGATLVAGLFGAHVDEEVDDAWSAPPAAVSEPAMGWSTAQSVPPPSA